MTYAFKAQVPNQVEIDTSGNSDWSVDFGDWSVDLSDGASVADGVIAISQAGTWLFGYDLGLSTSATGASSDVTTYVAHRNYSKEFTDTYLPSSGSVTHLQQTQFKGTGLYVCGEGDTFSLDGHSSSMPEGAYFVPSQSVVWLAYVGS